MKSFKIMTLLGVMMFTWAQSNAMEVSWPRGSWTEREMNRISQLPDDEVMGYFRSFWLQVKPSDLYTGQESAEGYFIRGSFKDDGLTNIANMFDARLRRRYRTKAPSTLGREVLLNGRAEV